MSVGAWLLIILAVIVHTIIAYSIVNDDDSEKHRTDNFLYIPPIIFIIVLVCLFLMLVSRTFEFFDNINSVK